MAELELIAPVVFEYLVAGAYTKSHRA